MTTPDHDSHSDRDASSDAADGLGGIVRRTLSTGPRPEERLEDLIAERRRELDEHAARFDESIADLERREELLRDSRASVERMLRLRTSDLEARESELTDFLRDLTERESRIAEAEGELARRRGELGAVELRRAAVEQRERAITVREDRIAERESHPNEVNAAPSSERPEPVFTVKLAFVPGLDYRLVAIEHPDLARGVAIELEGEEYEVARTGPSPLPGDRRRCAYLVRCTRGLSSGSS